MPPTASPSPSPGSSSRSSGTSPSLIARIRANETLAWDRLVTLYGPLVYRWCQRAGLQPSDVEDRFQEVFEAVFQHIQQFQKERAGQTFRGWLFTITRNKIRDHFRRQNREPRAPGGTEALRRLHSIADEATLDRGSTASQARQSLRDRTLDGLTEADRDDDKEVGALTHRALALIRSEFRESSWRAFWRTAIDELPAPDVADELGMSPGAVRVAKSRVLRRLREELGDIE